MTVVQLVEGTRRRLSGAWQESLFRTGHLLVANSVLTAAVGVGYWLLAARLYPPSVVGVNAAAISAMMLLAGAAQLNLMSALLRFVPTSGSAAGRMIRNAYLVGGGLSGVAAACFLIGLRYWAPDLTGVLGPAKGAASFVVATMLWAIFVMQDNALVAVGRAVAVPVENLAFALLKIVLIVVMSVSLAGSGIWLSWAAAMAVTVAGTTTYLFRRAIPAFVRASDPATEHVASLREVNRFVGPDYVGALAWIAGTSLVPLLVLDLTSRREAAVFALAWQICLALYQVPIAFGQSLVAHGVRHQDQLDTYYKKSLRHTLQLLAPVVALVVVLAPVGLRFFGAWYAENGVTTLRLLALSAIPNVVIGLAVSRARVAKRMTTVVVVLVTLSALVLGLTVVLVLRMGIAGGGAAALIGEGVVAGALLAHGWATGMRRRMLRARRGGVPGFMVRSALRDGKWRHERALATVSDTAVIMVRARQRGSAVLRVAATTNAVASLHRELGVLNRLRSEDRLGAWRELLPVPLSTGKVRGDGAFLLTSRLPGRSVQPGQAYGLTVAAIRAITPLHALSRTVRPVDAAMLDRWVDQPAQRISAAMGLNGSFDGMVASLRKDLAGRQVALGWTHGDFHPGNLLIDGSGQVSGIVDWSQAREQDLLALDIAFWLLTAPAAGQPREFGARVAAGPERHWTPAERSLLDSGPDCGLIPVRTLLTLTWLRHVADNFGKSERYARSLLWARRNVMPVLRQVTDG
jgi:O-antigen/teichoic acid export membrane protein